MMKRVYQPFFVISLLACFFLSVERCLAKPSSIRSIMPTTKQRLMQIPCAHGCVQQGKCLKVLNWGSMEHF